MEINPNQLPNDPAALRQMVVGLLGEAVERERKLRQLQHWVEQLLRARYGPRRERVDENQLFMFAAEIMARAEKTPPSSGETEATPAGAKSTPQRPGHGRSALPKSLPRQRVVHDLGEGARQCPQCQGEWKRMGEEVSERLEYVPASLIVIEEVCQKYACPKGCTVMTAEKPMAPVEKGLAGPGLLAQVAVSKYGDHLPLHRRKKRRNHDHQPCVHPTRSNAEVNDHEAGKHQTEECTRGAGVKLRIRTLPQEPQNQWQRERAHFNCAMLAACAFPPHFISLRK